MDARVIAETVTQAPVDLTRLPVFEAHARMKRNLAQFLNATTQTERDRLEQENEQLLRGIKEAENGS